MQSDTGRRRVVISGVKPEIDAGCFPIKRVLGEQVMVEANMFTDGHDVLNAALCYRRADEAVDEVPMASLGNDRWQGCFTGRSSDVCTIPGLGGSFRHMVSGTAQAACGWPGCGGRAADRGRTDRGCQPASRRSGRPAAGMGRSPAHAAQEVSAKGRLILQDATLVRLMALYPDRHLATTYRTSCPW